MNACLLAEITGGPPATEYARLRIGKIAALRADAWQKWLWRSDRWSTAVFFLLVTLFGNFNGQLIGMDFQQSRTCLVSVTMVGFIANVIAAGMCHRVNRPMAILLAAFYAGLAYIFFAMD